MKYVSAIILLVILWVATERVDAARPEKGPMGLIEETCAQTNHKDLCITSLTSDPNSFPADQTGLALVALRVASSNASDISESIKVMFNDSTLAEPSVQQGLFDCLDEYLDASQQLDDSIAAVLVKAYADVEKWVHAAIADVRTCAAAFGTQPSVLSQRNDVFIQLCDIALSIAKLSAAA